MQNKHILLVVGLLGSSAFTGLASAQEADAEPPTAASAAPKASVAVTSEAASSEDAPTAGHATGMMLQARIQAQSSLLSIGGSGFLVGYQAPSFALGLGLGLTRIGASSGADSGNAMLFQVAPTAIIDVWHSKDGRARANIIGSVGYAHASLSLNSSATSESCTSNANGVQTCTNSSSVSSATASASLIPITLGLGGDYFLSRNFALGAEFGFQAMFLAGVSSTSGGASQSIDAGGDLEMAYGALRATFVIGD